MTTRTPIRKLSIGNECIDFYNTLNIMQLDIQTQFNDIVLLIKQSQSNATQSVNAELINLYWNVGAYINLQLTNASWGDKTVDELATYIQKEYPVICDITNDTNTNS